MTLRGCCKVLDGNGQGCGGAPVIGHGEIAPIGGLDPLAVVQTAFGGIQSTADDIGQGDIPGAEIACISTEIFCSCNAIQYVVRSVGNGIVGLTIGA